jgi:hypothetical protein
VQYLRYGRFYVIIATHGVHFFFSAEAKRLRDVRKTPILFMCYAIGYRQARGGGGYHASVRINREYFRELKEQFLAAAVHSSVEDLGDSLHGLPFEPDAPVRVQLQTLLRAVNRKRKVAGLELVPYTAIRQRRAPVKPFETE